MQYIWLTLKPFKEIVYEHLKVNTAVSDRILNFYKWEITASNFGILLGRRNKFETLSSEAILIKRFNPILNS